MIRNFFSFAFDLIKIVTISLAIIMPVRYFLIQPFYVQGSSMEPNFHTSEYLIVNEIGYRFSDLERGDVIVFKYPVNPQEYFIKRIVALPGESIEFRDGDVYIYNDAFKDGVILDEEYLPEDRETYSNGRNEIVKLTDDEYFVLGDNRNSSKDSRVFGPVKKRLVIGSVLLRAWPFELFDTPIYQY